MYQGDSLMSGTKTLVNHCSSPLVVTLLGRNGADPSAPSDHKVTVNLLAGQTLQNVRYGTTKILISMDSSLH